MREEGLTRSSISFYSHDGFGLGQLSPTLFLANRVWRVEPAVDIHIITSSPAAHRLQALHDFAWIKLPLITKVQRKTRFVGYLGRSEPWRSRDDVRRSLGLTDERLVVLHTVCGGDGVRLVDAYLDAAPRLPDDVHSVVVAGPRMEGVERRRECAGALRGRMTFADYLDDLPSYIAAADLSISMGGYNTICEVLSAGVPARAVPRIFPRKEQYMRAQLLALRGLLRVILPNFLRPDYLAAVRAALESPRPRARQINLHGGERAAVFFSSLLRRRNHAEIRLCARSGT